MARVPKSKEVSKNDTAIDRAKMAEILEENARLKATLEFNSKKGSDSGIDDITQKYDTRIALLKEEWESGDNNAYNKLVSLEVEKRKALDEYKVEQGKKRTALTTEGIVNILKSLGVETTVDSIEEKLSAKMLKNVKKDGIMPHLTDIIDTMDLDAGSTDDAKGQKNKGEDNSMNTSDIWSSIPFEVSGLDGDSKSQNTDTVMIKGVKHRQTGKLNDTLKVSKDEYNQLMGEVEEELKRHQLMVERAKNSAELDSLV